MMEYHVLGYWPKGRISSSREASLDIQQTRCSSLASSKEQNRNRRMRESGGLSRMGNLSASVPSIGEDRVLEGWNSLDQKEYQTSTLGNCLH